MAGTYPDVPAPRIAWDRLGGTLSVSAIASGAAGMDWTVTDPAELAKANNEAEDFPAIGGTANANSSLQIEAILALPYEITFYGMFIAIRTHTNADIAGSANPRIEVLRGNIWEQVWSSTGTPNAHAVASVTPAYRGAIKVAAVPLTNVSAVRWYQSSILFQMWRPQIRAFHVYGTPTVPTQLQLWHPTLDQALGGADLDLGDVNKGSTYTETFRVKNNTGSALTITVSSESLTGVMDDGIDFSIGGGAYAASLDIGAVAAGAISDVVTLRREVPIGATSGLKAARVILTAA